MSNQIKIGVGILILNTESHLLLGLRGPNVKENLGKWELLGGEVNYDEKLENAVKRHAKEEAGIEVMPQVILGSNDKYENEKNIRWVGITWLAKLISGEPHVVPQFNRDSDFCWTTLEKALTMDITSMTHFQLLQYQNWLEKIKL